MIEPDEPPAWDADDPRRQDDCFAPPTEPCDCWCMHCGRTFSSEGIWLQRIVPAKPGALNGYWMCPTPNCGGAGFTFDIFPTDPNHPANAGWHDSDDGEEEFEDEDEDRFDDDDDEGEFEAEDLEFAHDNSDAAVAMDSGSSLASESEDDNPFGGSDDDSVIEPGDEWKLGYAPDEPAPPGIYGDANTRAEQAKYDAPDERPRVIDRSSEPPDKLRGTDDIPF